jgi:hypothetical protein
MALIMSELYQGSSPASPLLKLELKQRLLKASIRGSIKWQGWQDCR